MRYKNGITINQALNQMVSDLKLKPKLDECRIRELWPIMMGKTVAKYTTKVSVYNAKLYIEVNSAALKNELLYSRQTIIERINTELGNVVIKEVIVY